jgi:hypothetical protein
MDAVARRLDPSFDGLPEPAREDLRRRLEEIRSALEAEGWELTSRLDRTTYEMAQWVFLRVDATIAAATPKAVILLSLHGAIVSIVALQGQKIVEGVGHGLGWVAGIFLLGLFLSSILALWFVFASVIPRVAPHTDRRSLLFFGTIAARPREEFVAEFLRCDRQTFLRDLVHDLHSLSELADQKHRTFVRAFRTVLLVEIPLMAALAVLIATTT